LGYVQRPIARVVRVVLLDTRMEPQTSIYFRPMLARIDTSQLFLEASVAILAAI
jgi:hypothetical protein